MNRIQRLRIVFPMLTVFLVWLFLWGVPAHIFNQYRIFFTLIAGISTSLSLGITLFLFLPVPKHGSAKSEKRVGNLAIFFALFSIAFFFA